MHSLLLSGIVKQNSIFFCIISLLCRPPLSDKSWLATIFHSHPNLGLSVAIPSIMKLIRGIRDAESNNHNWQYLAGGDRLIMRVVRVLEHGVRGLGQRRREDKSFSQVFDLQKRIYSAILVDNVSRRMSGKSFFFFTTLLQNHFGKRLNRLPMSLRRAAISSAREFLGSGNNGRELYFRSRWSTMGL